MVKWRTNPLYEPKPRWELRGRALWLWRGLLTTFLVAFLIFGTLRSAAVFAALWIVVEARRLRRERSGPPTSKGGSDRKCDTARKQ